MNLIDALNESACDAATYINQNNIEWNVDGSGDSWYVTSGVSGMPVSETHEFTTRDAAIASLPAVIAASEDWEPTESE